MKETVYLTSQYITLSHIVRVRIFSPNSTRGFCVCYSQHGNKRTMAPQTQARKREQFCFCFYRVFAAGLCSAEEYTHKANKETKIYDVLHASCVCVCEECDTPTQYCGLSPLIRCNDLFLSKVKRVHTQSVCVYLSFSSYGIDAL